MTNVLHETTTYLARPEGRIGYDVGGQGPLVVLRSTDQIRVLLGCNGFVVGGGRKNTVE